MFFVVWQPFILSTGVSVVDLGVIQSVINLSSAAGLIAWGALSDRFGRKPVILVSQVSRLLAMVALVVSGDFVFLLAFAFLIGFSALFMVGNPARSALTSESVGSQRRATAFSTLMSISQITSTATASAGGYIAVTSGYTPILYACVIGDSVGLLLLTIYLKETHEATAVDAKPRESIVTRLRGLFAPEPGIGRLYLMLFVTGLGYGTGYSLFYGTLVDSYGLTDFQLGLLSTTFNLSWGLASIPVGKLSDRSGRRTMLLASWAMALTTVLGFLTFRSFAAFLLFQVTWALDPAFWIPTWMTLLSEKVPPDRLSTVMGKIDAYSKISGIPTPWLAGLLYSAYGFSAPLIVHLALLTVSGILIYTIKEK
jgi:MFS family permease